jgi:asparagine N-glycosylation enzyme membrane subunit Stt3
MADDPADPADPAAGRPAWYAASPGTWRDWVTVLHLPYTAWNLSYVLIGAGLASRVDGVRLAYTLLAFALAVGVAAHALDELRGHPLGTTIASPVLAAVAGIALAGAVVVGGVGIGRVGWGLAAFIAVGVVLVVAYNLELWGGRLHTDAVFAAAWGAFPLLTAYYAQTATIRPAAVVGAVFAYGLSRAQRVLSTEARHVRRRLLSVTGERVDADGTRQEITRAVLLRPLERALVALSWSTCALGVALVVARGGH